MSDDASSSRNTSGNPLAGSSVAEKLTQENFLLWEMAVLPVIRGAQIEGFITGEKKAPPQTISITKGDKGETVEEPNPAYATW